MTAITNYYKHTDLKQDKFMTLQFCVLEVQHSFHCAKIKVTTEISSFLEALEENHFLCLFQLLRATTFLGSWSPSFIFKASNGMQSPSYKVWLSLLLPSFTFTILVIVLDQIMQDNFFFYFKGSWLAPLFPLHPQSPFVMQHSTVTGGMNLNFDNFGRGGRFDNYFVYPICVLYYLDMG